MVTSGCKWTFAELDAGIARELDSLLPSRVFDAHAHIYRVSDLNVPEPGIFHGDDEEVTVETWRRHTGMQCGESKLRGGLFFGAPTAGCDMDRENDFVLAQLKSCPDSRGLIVRSPDSQPEKVAAYLSNPQIVGFKPYHVFSPEIPTFQSSIGGFLPEWIWEMADLSGLIITLHLVKDGALASDDVKARLNGPVADTGFSRLI